jgi:prephenate dehydrogenase/prephenate dehydratase
MEIHSLGIVGFGRFGRFWAGVLKNLYPVVACDRDPALAAAASALGVAFMPLEELCRQADLVFLCVPINQIEIIARQIAPLARPGMIIADTCSVKAYPAQMMEQYLGKVAGLSLVLTHPMFGPDSGANGVAGLPVVLWPLHAAAEVMELFRGLFNQLGLRIVEISPDEHDRLAANSQGITHQVGRILDEMKVQSTPIDTRGFKSILSVVEQTCHDTWELFCDQQNYNAYTSAMRYRLEYALERVNSRLLPERVSPDELVIGVQGGKGSFNEEACRYYCAQHLREIPRYRIEFLYTSHNVLTALHTGRIDRGVFAIQNAAGGAVMETIHALTHHPCEILEIFDVVISHCILHHPGIAFSQVDTIISHPQAIAQCAENLKMLYPHLRLVSGEGDLIDQALCAEYIASGKLPATTAVLAPRACAALYDLTVQDTDLQDLGKKNLTTFAWAQRRRFAAM